MMITLKMIEKKNIILIMNKNYQQFLASIDKEPSLKYLKEEYPKIIQSFQVIIVLSQ